LPTQIKTACPIGQAVFYVQNQFINSVDIQGISPK